MGFRALLHRHDKTVAPVPRRRRHGRVSRHIYLPTSATLAMIHARPDRPPDTIAVVGPKGAVSIASYFAGLASPSLAVVLTGGRACRMASLTFLAEFHRKDAPMPLLLRYTVALTAKVVQGIAQAAQLLQFRAPTVLTAAPVALAASGPRSLAPTARHPRRPAAPSTNSHVQAMSAPGSTLGVRTVPPRGRPCGRSGRRTSRVSNRQHWGRRGRTCRPLWARGRSWGEPLPVRTVAPRKNKAHRRGACHARCSLLLAAVSAIQIGSRR